MSNVEEIQHRLNKGQYDEPQACDDITYLVARVEAYKEIVFEGNHTQIELQRHIDELSVYADGLEGYIEELEEYKSMYKGLEK